MPFNVCYFSDEGIRIFHKFTPQVPLYLDATGTITSLKGTRYESSKQGHPQPKNPPVAVVELISTEHSALAVSSFLQEFRRHEALLYKYENAVPQSIVNDRSIVLLLSVLQAFCKEDLRQYLHRCFRLLTNCPLPRDNQQPLVFGCISHIMKSAKMDMKKLL